MVSCSLILIPAVRTELCVSSVQISQEVDRRRRLGVTSAERVAAIKDVYQPLHPHVYRLQVFSASTTPIVPVIMCR